MAAEKKKAVGNSGGCAAGKSGGSTSVGCPFEEETFRCLGVLKVRITETALEVGKMDEQITRLEKTIFKERFATSLLLLTVFLLIVVLVKAIFSDPSKLGLPMKVL
ncbi:hypothetical protein OROGR_003237 [Orobanche gracilis]